MQLLSNNNTHCTPHSYLIESYGQLNFEQVEIDEMSEEYVTEAKRLTASERVQKIKKIQESYSKCRNFADDKVQLAMQTYEMVTVCSHSNLVLC